MINLKKMQLRMKMVNETINLPVAAVVEAAEVVEVVTAVEIEMETEKIVGIGEAVDVVNAAEEVVGEEEVAVDLAADLETTMTKTKILEDLVVASVVMIKMKTQVVDSVVASAATMMILLVAAEVADEAGAEEEAVATVLQ